VRFWAPTAAGEQCTNTEYQGQDCLLTTPVPFCSGFFVPTAASPALVNARLEWRRHCGGLLGGGAAAPLPPLACSW